MSPHQIHRFLIVCIVSTLSFSGCSNQSLKHEPIKTLLDQRVQQLEQDQLNFKTIEAIILTTDSTLIAVIRPQSVKQYSTERVLQGEQGKWEGQIAEWELLYIAKSTTLKSACNEFWMALEHRLTPETPKRQDLIIIPNLKYIEFGWGTADNNLMIEQDEIAPAEFDWNFYTSSGQACSGQVSFVLQPHSTD